MSSTFTLVRSHRMLALLSIGLLAAIALAACSSPAASTPTRPAATTAAPQAESPTEAVPTSASAETSPGEAAASGVSFSKDVLPILEANCTKCHGSERASGGLNLTSYADLMKGSKDGAVITAGDAAKSTLVDLISTGKMPRGADKLSDDQIKLITDWVNAGAEDN